MIICICDLHSYPLLNKAEQFQFPKTDNYSANEYTGEGLM